MRGVLAAVLRRLAHRLEPRASYDLRVHMDGEAIVREIKRRNRRQGLPPGSLA